MVENLALEFGEDLDQTLAAGSKLSPELKQLLVTKAKPATDKRAQLMDALNRVVESLKDARDALSSSDAVLEPYRELASQLTPYHHLPEGWDRLDALEENIEGVLRELQEPLQAEQLDVCSLKDSPELKRLPKRLTPNQLSGAQSRYDLSRTYPSCASNVNVRVSQSELNLPGTNRPGMR